MDTQYVTNFQFRGSGICSYAEYIGTKRSRGDITYRPPQKDRGKASGNMTLSSLRRCKKYLDLWSNAILSVTKQSKNPRRSYAKFLTFVTLTLPSSQAHSDKFIKRQILTPFISELLRLHHVNQYLWKAEPQQNGNIHFHMLIDRYIRHDVLRWSWNRFLEPYDYIKAYQNQRKTIAPLELLFLSKFQPYAQISSNITRIDHVYNSLVSNSKFEDSIRLYLLRFCKYIKRQQPQTKFQDIQNRILSDQAAGFINPNSTDIHAPHKIKNLTCYVLKYLSKKNSKKILRPAACFEQEEITQMEQEQNFENLCNISGRVWGCSDGLRKLNYFITTEDTTTINFLEYIKQHNIPRVFQGDFFEMLSFNLYETLGKYCKSLFNQIKNHFKSLFYLLYPDSTDVGLLLTVT